MACRLASLCCSRLGISESPLFGGPRVLTPVALDIAGLTVRLSRRRSLRDAAFFYLASLYLFDPGALTLHPSRTSSWA